MVMIYRSSLPSRSNSLLGATTTEHTAESGSVAPVQSEVDVKPFGLSAKMARYPPLGGHRAR